VVWLPTELTGHWTPVRTGGRNEFLMFRLNQVLGLGVCAFVAILFPFLHPAPGVAHQGEILAGLIAGWLFAVWFFLRGLKVGLQVSTTGVRVVGFFGTDRVS